MGVTFVICGPHIIVMCHWSSNGLIGGIFLINFNKVWGRTLLGVVKK
jgi:hypothetical protein